MSDIKKTVLTHDQENEVEKHLDFINHITQESIKYGYRAIIGGGYAVDGAIGDITRPHNDIDIQLYGTDVLNPVLLAEMCLTGQYSDLTIDDRGRNDYWHTFFINGVGAEIYYMRVATKPFSETKIVIKSDGKYSEEHDFEAKMVILKGVRYEVQNPIVELADKIYKREHRREKILQKHDQDMHNLSLITDPYDVQTELNKLIKGHASTL